MRRSDSHALLCKPKLMKISLNSPPPESLLKDKQEAECQDQWLLAHGQQSVYSSYTPHDFYRGELATAMAEDLARIGSPVSRDDLAYHARVVEPLSTRLRNATLYNQPPPT